MQIHSPMGVVLLIGIATASPLAAQLKAKSDLEEAATKLKVFSAWDVTLPTDLRREHQDRLDELRNHKHATKDLIAFLEHKEPRVRTLAAFLLYQSGEHKLLPYLVPLAKDPALTFQRTANVANFLRPDQLPPLEEQTVGQVVSYYLDTYLILAGYQAGVNGNRDYPGFDDYWSKRKDRAHCASWFYQDIRRAEEKARTPAANKEAIKAVRARIDKLAEPDRTFTLLWLSRGQIENLVSDDELIAGCKKIGPEKLLQLLDHKIPSDDPDLQSRIRNDTFYTGMMYFVLKHASKFLRAEDADAVLEYARKENTANRSGLGIYSPAWYDAAIALQPDKKRAILDRAWVLIRESKHSSRWMSPTKLALAMWTRHEDDSLAFVVNLFYHEQPRRGDENNMRAAFLDKLSYDVKPANRKLFAAIVNDKRFDTLDWVTIIALAELANRWEKREVIIQKELDNLSHPLGRSHYHWDRELARKEYTTETEALETSLAAWRLTLRKTLGVP